MFLGLALWILIIALVGVYGIKAIPLLLQELNYCKMNNWNLYDKNYDRNSFLGELIGFYYWIPPRLVILLFLGIRIIAFFSVIGFSIYNSVLIFLD